MTEPVLIAEGKTKQLWTTPDVVRIKTKDDITAGDGAKHDVFEGKAEYSTEFNCNVMELLRRKGIPVAYIGRFSATEFLALKCEMYPYEVVIRAIALGSCLERDKSLKRGDPFDPPVVEFYLKTNNKEFRGISLEKDDPIVIDKSPSGLVVANPHVERDTGKPVWITSHLLGWEPDGSMDPFSDMEKIAAQVFGILRGAWYHRFGLILGDLKIEFGLTPDGRLVVGDVIDQDSGRILTPQLVHLDKQRYRDGETLEKVQSLYHEMAERSKMLLQY